MLRKKSGKILKSPITAAVCTCAVWAAVLNALYIVSDKLISSVGIYMLSFGFVFPAVSLFLNFRFGKRHGARWYLYLMEIAAVTAEYLSVGNFSEISPNVIVVTILCAVFGIGLGSCFSDEAAIRADDEKRKKGRSGENKPYRKILDDKPNKR